LWIRIDRFDHRVVFADAFTMTHHPCTAKHSKRLGASDGFAMALKPLYGLFHAYSERGKVTTPTRQVAHGALSASTQAGRSGCFLYQAVWDALEEAVLLRLTDVSAKIRASAASILARLPCPDEVQSSRISATTLLVV
jgi:hypothetical protein